MKQLILSYALFGAAAASAQTGILPFTGMTYTAKGLQGKAITAELEDYTWTSNRLPIGAEFTIAVKEPTGLKREDDMYYPGIEVLLTTTKGDTLGYAVDIFGDDGVPALGEEGLDRLTLRLSFGDDVHPGDTCLLTARFYDKKSPADLTLSMPIVMTDRSSAPEHTASTFSVTSYRGHSAMASGDIVLSGMTMSVDDQRHHRLNILTLHLLVQGVSEEEWKNGTVESWWYDDGVLVPLTDRDADVYVVPEGENLSVDAIVRMMPLPPVRIRWQSADRTKVVELLADAAAGN